MTITLYRYMGEREKVDKSSDLILVATASGQFKAETNVLNPSLLLSLPQEGVTLVTDENGNLIADVITYDGNDSEILNFNYFYIAEFRRYYFLSSLVVSSHNLLIVSGEVDPLYSFKDQILSNDAFIERNEFTYDLMQEDNLLPLKMVWDVTESVPVMGGMVNCDFQADFSDDPNYKNFICSFVNQAGAGRVINSPSGLPVIDSTKFGDSSGNMCLAMDQINTITLVTDLLGDYSSYSTFFKGLIAYPINLRPFSDYPTFSNVTIYKEDLDTQQYSPITLNAAGCPIANNSPYLIVADFDLPTPSSFLDLNPYSHYELYLPFYGYHELNINQIGGHRLIVYYSVTFETGAGEVYIYDYTGERLIFSSSVQLGITISLPSTNAQEQQAQKNAAQLNLILSLIGSGVGMIGSAVSGNALGVVGSGLAGVQAVTSYINQLSLMFERAQTTHNGTAGGLYSPLEVRLKVSKSTSRAGLDMSKFAHQYGRPLRDVRKLSTLSGFTQVSKVHLEGCDATEGEKAQIESSLLAGVIL